MLWRLVLLLLQQSLLCWAFSSSVLPNVAAKLQLHKDPLRKASRLFAQKVAVGDRLLWAEGLNKMYSADRHQLRDVKITLSSGQRAGLVGINGAGKSTLLKVLAGIEKPDSGTVTLPTGAVVSYAEQEPPNSDKLIREVLFSGDQPLLAALLEYYTVMQDDTLNGDRFRKAIDDTHDLGHLEIRPLIDELEEVMGIDEDQWDKPMNQLSGGQRRKVGLMSAFFKRPDVLLLDEPTNHLDVDTIDWLVSYLKSGVNKHMAILTITHDRYFLDALCSDIYELDKGGLYKFEDCNYSKYVERREIRVAAADAKLANQKAILAKEQAWVIKRPKGRQAKNRGRVERYEELKAEVEKEPELTKPVDLSVVGESARLGSALIELQDASLTVGYHSIFKDFNLTIGAGDAIGIVGENGAGKSSLLRAVLGELPLDKGLRLAGNAVRFGYYDQRGIQLTPENRLQTVMQFVETQVLKAGTEVLTSEEAQRLLVAFQFRGDRWYSFVSDLSGGERRRLQLLQVLASQPNVLILDEPTNDLDLATLEALEDYILNQFEGALICVSHDRFFMDRMVDRLLAFKSSGALVSFHGSYTQYLKVLRKEREDERAARAAAEAAAQAAEEERRKKIAAKQAMYAQFHKKKSKN